jgi:hypothetical protein
MRAVELTTMLESAAHARLSEAAGAARVLPAHSKQFYQP